MRRDPKKDHITCSCKKEHFEVVRVHKFPVLQDAVIGQAPVPDFDEGPFFFLRCIFCNTLIEPKIVRNIRDPMNKAYDELLDAIEENQGKTTDAEEV